MSQNPNEFHQELYALSMRAVINASTYTSCIVNGVKFMVLDRDSQRTTQNSGVSVEDENNVKHYGQLEEIIEVAYPYRYSTVLFRCKWFDPCGYSFECNKDDQLIFASQAKQVFYIREPSRGNQNNNHRWVVEHVNHRKIWDLPLNDGRIEDVPNEFAENVENDLAESVDAVHNNSSFDCKLVFDFGQYFQNINEVPDTMESYAETDPPTITVNEVSDAETDYDENDPDYDTEESEQDIVVYDGESD